ncbi:MAG TPA: hypothetical protein DDZ89_20405 [Clostridiales bacterium]|nr:hypothetical protein [Clostridiales bacterium]
MKRIKSACIEQTIHFQLKEDLGHAAAAKSVKDELAQFKEKLENKRSKFKILEEIVQPDDSIILKIKKQYNDYDCGDYLA